MTLRFTFGETTSIEIHSTGPDEGLKLEAGRVVAAKPYAIEDILKGMELEAQALNLAAQNGTHPDSNKSHEEKILGCIATSDTRFHNEQFLKAAVSKGKSSIFIPVAVDPYCLTLSQHVLRARQLTPDCVV